MKFEKRHVRKGTVFGDARDRWTIVDVNRAEGTFTEKIHGDKDTCVNVIDMYEEYGTYLLYKYPNFIGKKYKQI